MDVDPPEPLPQAVSPSSGLSAAQRSFRSSSYSPLVRKRVSLPSFSEIDVDGGTAAGEQPRLRLPLPMGLALSNGNATSYEPVDAYRDAARGLGFGADEFEEDTNPSSNGTSASSLGSSLSNGLLARRVSSGYITQRFGHRRVVSASSIVFRDLDGTISSPSSTSSPPPQSAPASFRPHYGLAPSPSTPVIFTNNQRYATRHGRHPYFPQSVEPTLSNSMSGLAHRRAASLSALQQQHHQLQQQQQFQMQQQYPHHQRQTGSQHHSASSMMLSIPSFDASAYDAELMRLKLQGISFDTPPAPFFSQPVRVHQTTSAPTSPVTRHKPAMVQSMGPMTTNPSIFAMFDQPSMSKGKRRRASASQVRMLNAVFETTCFPSTEQRNRLAHELGMTPRAVQIWFQNKRQGVKNRTKVDLKSVPGAGLMINSNMSVVGNVGHEFFSDWNASVKSRGDEELIIEEEMGDDCALTLEQQQRYSQSHPNLMMQGGSAGGMIFANPGSSMVGGGPPQRAKTSISPKRDAAPQQRMMMGHRRSYTSSVELEMQQQQQQFILTPGPTEAWGSPAGPPTYGLGPVRSREIPRNVGSYSAGGLRANSGTSSAGVSGGSAQQLPGIQEMLRGGFDNNFA